MDYALGAAVAALVASKEIADLSNLILVPPSTSIKNVVSLDPTILPCIPAVVITLSPIPKSATNFLWSLAFLVTF